MNQPEVATIEIRSSYYKELKKNPLFFIYQKCEFDERGEPNYSWGTNNNSILSLNIPPINFEIFSDELIIVEIKQNENLEQKQDTIKLPVHRFSSSEIKDWYVIFNSYLSRLNNRIDKYNHIALLWCLNRKIPENTVIKAIHHYDSKIQTCLTRVLKKIAVCLSVNKQKTLQKILFEFNVDYKVYCPEVLQNALNIIFPEFNYSESDYNPFDAIDLIFEDNNEALPVKQNMTNIHESDNLLLSLYIWLSEPTKSFTDYNGLKRCFSLFSESQKLNIIKRYFYDIHQGCTSYNEELIKSFKNNHLQTFSIFRHCIKSPSTPIKLAIPLLCDCVMTIRQTKGNELQTFNGILDMATMYCDTVMPKIDLELEKLLPTCYGGAKYNSWFDGFIFYESIYNLNEDKLLSPTLEEIAKNLLNKYAQRKYDYFCENSSSSEILSSKQVANCKKINAKCLKQKYYNVWHINSSENIPVLKLFLRESPTYGFEINWENISIDIFKDNIKKSGELWGQNIGNGYTFKNLNTWQKDIIETFYRITHIRIYPRPNVVLNPIFNLFKLQGNDHEIASQESHELKERIIQSLTQVLKTNISPAGFFEIPYDNSHFQNIKKLYYYQRHESTKDGNIFLKRFKNSKYTNFCAPKLYPQHNIATDLPYFWCRGKECFRNNLDRQALENNISWQQYSLLHIIEISGYPKLHKTEAGYEADDTIRQFIALANRAFIKFQRLTCRCCGHLIFPHFQNNNYNIYNHYSCINPTCEEYKHPIYLNYCYHCKIGLIDSRDTKQCPNGWYICPQCLACCNDELYNKQAQRYVLAQKSIPTRLQEKINQGHNNKGIFFCSSCGAQIIIENKDSAIYQCTACKKEFTPQKKNIDS